MRYSSKNVHKVLQMCFSNVIYRIVDIQLFHEHHIYASFSRPRKWPGTLRSFVVTADLRSQWQKIRHEAETATKWERPKHQGNFSMIFGWRLSSVQDVVLFWVPFVHFNCPGGIDGQRRRIASCGVSHFRNHKINIFCLENHNLNL